MAKQPSKLIAKLNEDLAGEFGAIIQYLTYAAKVTGPYRPQLAQFFLAEVADEQLHAQFLANKIVALGGEPTTVPRPVAPAQYQSRDAEVFSRPNARDEGLPSAVRRTRSGTRASRSTRTWSGQRARRGDG
jgi:ferritin